MKRKSPRNRPLIAELMPVRAAAERMDLRTANLSSHLMTVEFPEQDDSQVILTFMLNKNAQLVASVELERAGHVQCATPYLRGAMLRNSLSATLDDYDVERDRIASVIAFLDSIV